MKPKRRRLYFVVFGMLTLGAAAVLILSALEENIVFFYSPTEVAEKAIAPGLHFRIGGLVEENSVKHHTDSMTTEFNVTDLNHTIPVAYRGILPDLFREGQGVVAEGALGPDGVFRATEILAKHDENYMPPGVAEALKKSGRWQEGTAE